MHLYHCERGQDYSRSVLNTFANRFYPTQDANDFFGVHSGFTTAGRGQTRLRLVIIKLTETRHTRRRVDQVGQTRAYTLASKWPTETR